MKSKKRDSLFVNPIYVLLAVVVGALVMLPGIGQQLFGQASQTRTGRVPTFQLDPNWLKVPAKWKLGEVSSVAVDAQDHVWILHRPRAIPEADKAMAAPSVLEFDAAGNFIQAWGGPGTGKGYEWPEREHGIYVDYKGYVWIGGNNCKARNLPGLRPVDDDQLLKFTKAGKLVKQIGNADKSGGNNDPKNFSQPADIFVYRKTNEAFIADGYGNHRVIVLDADTGAFKRMWGAFGSKPVDDHHCPPSTAASTDTEGPGSPQFYVVHTARVSNDGLVYVGDRENKRVQVFTIDGKFVTQSFIGRKRPDGGAVVNPGGLAFSPDPQQEFLYAAGTAGVVMYNRKTFEVLNSIPGINVHHVATDSKGNVYTAEVGQRRVQKFVFKGVSPASSQ